MRPAGSLWVKLNRKRRHIVITYAFAGPVVCIDIEKLRTIRQAVGHHRITMVLAGDVYTPRPEIFHRLVSSPMPIFELFRGRPLRAVSYTHLDVYKRQMTPNT